jgi:hypothetical protein
VLTRGLPDEHGPDAPALEAEHRKGHAALAQLSRRGTLIVAEHSGHHIQLDEPQLVVTKIQEVVGLIQFRGHLPKGGYDVPNGQHDEEPAAAPAV